MGYDRKHEKDTDYYVNIMVSEEIYEKYKDRLQAKGIQVYGHTSRVRAINKVIFEYSLENLEDKHIDKIIKDLVVKK